MTPFSIVFLYSNDFASSSDNHFHSSLQMLFLWISGTNSYKLDIFVFCATFQSHHDLNRLFNESKNKTCSVLGDYKGAQR